MKKKKTRFGLGISLFFTIVVLIELALALGFGYVLSMVLEKPLNISPTEIIVVVSIVLGTVIAFAVNRLFLRPIITLSEAMEQVASGDFTLQLKTKSLVKEIRNIFDNFNLMTKELDATETLQSDFMSNVSHEIKHRLRQLKDIQPCFREQTTLMKPKQHISRRFFLTQKDFLIWWETFCSFQKLIIRQLKRKKLFFD